jgi:Helix-turn-helix domain
MSDEGSEFKPLFDWRAAIASEESGLTPPTRLVALVLSLYMSPKGTSCFPSVARLARETGLGESTVRASLRRLEGDLGGGRRGPEWLVCVERGGIKGERRRASSYEARMPTPSGDDGVQAYTPSGGGGVPRQETAPTPPGDGPHLSKELPIELPIELSIEPAGSGTLSSAGDDHLAAVVVETSTSTGFLSMNDLPWESPPVPDPPPRRRGRSRLTAAANERTGGRGAGKSVGYRLARVRLAARSNGVVPLRQRVDALASVCAAVMAAGGHSEATVEAALSRIPADVRVSDKRLASECRKVAAEADPEQADRASAVHQAPPLPFFAHDCPAGCGLWLGDVEQAREHQREHQRGAVG